MLKILVGPNPKQLSELIPNDTDGIIIESPGFKGKFVIFLPQYTDSNFPTKHFSLQLTCNFHPVNSQYGVIHPNFDNVLFGVELDKILNLNALGLPKWLIMAIELWLKNLSGEVKLCNMIKDQKVINQSQIHPASALFLPLVLVANNMHVNLKTNIDQLFLYQSFMDTHQTYNASPQSMYQRQAEWKVLTQAKSVQRPRYVQNPQNKSHQFQQEIQENTDYILASRLSYEGKIDELMAYGFKQILSGRDRRNLLRDKTTILQSLKNMITQQSSDNAAQLFRESIPYHESLDYTLELNSDYFDPQTFIFAPNLNKQELKTSVAGPPTSLMQFFNGRWNVDAKQILGERDQFGNRVSRVNLVCRNKVTLQYYFCISMILTD